MRGSRVWGAVLAVAACGLCGSTAQLAPRQEADAAGVLQRLQLPGDAPIVGGLPERLRAVGQRRQFPWTPAVNLERPRGPGQKLYQELAPAVVVVRPARATAPASSCTPTAGS